MQPCKSPVWDTAITLRALAASGMPAQHEAFAARRRLAARPTDSPARRLGRNDVDAEPGGWCFEYANEFYPDLDDTAMVLMALAGTICLAASTSASGARARSEQACRDATTHRAPCSR